MNHVSYDEKAQKNDKKYYVKIKKKSFNFLRNLFKIKNFFINNTDMRIDEENIQRSPRLVNQGMII